MFGGSNERRNEQRKLVIGIIDPAARLVLAAGLIKPVFSPGVDDILTLLGAVAMSFGLWSVVAYLIFKMEDEE